MNDTQLDALVEAADEGIDYDGLRVTHDAGVYTFETPGEPYEGLDEDGFREVATENPWLVSNWYFWTQADRPEPEQAFLRWLEGADERSVTERYEAMADGGLTESWGQLHIEIALGDDGTRVYTLRNEEDADADLDSLAVHTDPLDARELVKHDDRGRYRPLKTAPTLPTGWAFVDLDGRALGRAVDVIYPVTIANWHLERQGELDVSHWVPTMERQTGIYGVIETWNRGDGHEHVDWVAEACCDDSQCLKRREWDYDAETDLDVDGGDGEFPCREPCSLVIAAARQWTKLEGEETQTYEFELTPSEKEQIEAIIDAVADGEADEVREADVYDGANRYRTRFLRAKRFDEEGNLCGVPTDDE
ncbi:DR2241 family protein [Natronomonas amylolytica]|uniref:DR2241 family protein n=1 Tax=Natronomonas amylolytica TaxID=3108498 RepID=UPI003009B54C